MGLVHDEITRKNSKSRAQKKYVLGKIVNSLAKTILETHSAPVSK